MDETQSVISSFGFAEWLALLGFFATGVGFALKIVWKLSQLTTQFEEWKTDSIEVRSHLSQCDADREVFRQVADRHEDIIADHGARIVNLEGGGD